jgi:hypothetical protein
MINLRPLAGVAVWGGLFAAAFAFDSASTPGASNPSVTQSNIDATICARGWTATIRPPESYTSAIKRKLLAGLSDSNPRHYELDHRVPLELGGAPYDERNLWVQPWEGRCGALVKDQEENRLHLAVCNRAMSLADAQAAMLAWVRDCRP